MSGLFGTLHVGKSGIFANQRSIDVTSHNIANANTEGYSRQRAELQTERPFCTPSMNNAAGAGQLGRGVNVADINRIRDTFLDYQVRIELGVQGKYAGRHKFLNEIENIFNEPSETGISTLLGNFFDGWQELSKQPQSSNARTVVAEQSKALTDELNHLYGQLHKLKDNAKTSIRQDLNDVNSILDQMERLNEEIIQVTAAGQKPNDLLDRRDLLLDKLSSKFGINIEKKGLNGIDVNTKGDAEPPDGLNLIQMVKPEEALRFAYISSIESKKGTDGKEIAADQYGKKTYTVTYYKNADMTDEKNKVEMTIKLSDDEYKALDKSRTLWTDKSGNPVGEDGNILDKYGNRIDEDGNLIIEDGNLISEDGKIKYTKVEGENYDFTSADNSEFFKYNEDGNLVEVDKDGNPVKVDEDGTPKVVSLKKVKLPTFQPSTGNLNGYMSVQDDIDNQIEQLDKLARTLAYAVNAVHSQNEEYLSTDLQFFVNKDGGTEDKITAGNITVNKDILKDVMQIKVGKNVPKPGETDGTRALAIANIMDKLIEIQNLDLKSMDRKNFITTLCNGAMKTDEAGILTLEASTDGMTFGGYFKDMVDRLGVQTQEAKRMVKNQHSVLASFQQSRDAVSGVSLDEEMTNLIQFQHAYQANAKLISTVDELLDVVVNGLKR
ncbi:MAG: flagellar hook-associated protein FlgK [Clostridium thermopalmarium]|uniref:flagellar hook-associated protein FlgK n=1 Tax=Clostridium TaxID=1485 RepID=UPI002353D7BF|nr:MULTISPECIES: flagellar hook-associated protein FlgK [Clostridium]MBE6044358.1 flagellar hook-associated protein FlgK [Clostridium thermopalmarium]MBE6064851.1 flagellar hook-associated protein FlgK [Clostridium cochlearium]